VHHRLARYSEGKNCMALCQSDFSLMGRKNIDKSRVRKWKTEHSEKKRARKGQFSRKYDDDDW
jgi:hypothetical protein